MLAQRKASEQTNWTRGLFTVSNRSAGTDLAFPEYRLREFPRSIFYRYERAQACEGDVTNFW